MPSTLRLRLVRAAQRRASASAAIVIAANGDKGAALAMLRRAATDVSQHKLRRLIAAAAALDAPHEARDLLNRLPVDDSARPHLSALVQAREGHLATAAAAVPRGLRGRRVRRRFVAELQAISSSVATVRPTSAVYEGVPGRVLHLVTNALPETTAGYTIRTHGIVTSQRADGFDAHVATRLGYPVTSGKLAAAARISLDGVPYHRTIPLFGLPPDNDRLLAADISATSRLVRKLKPVVLHAHSKHTNAQVALALRARHGIPVVYEVRGFLEETWRSRGRDARTDLYRRAREIETQCMLAADAIVTISESMRDEIVSRGVPRNKIDVIPNATDESLPRERRDPQVLRHSLGIRPNEVVIGALSTLNAYEGIDVLIEAFAKLHTAAGLTRLLIVGDGPARSGLVELASIYRLGDRVIFPGRVPYGDVSTYHSAIDIFCVPRLDTPVTRLVPPLKPIEALATGRPVVASDLAPLREIVHAEQTGLLVRPSDSGDLANALEALVRDPDLRRQLGEQARSWVATNRTWQVLQQHYRDIYGRLGAVHDTHAVGSR